MSGECRHVIVLGGIGEDCHSVGLSILRQSLTARGHHVRFLGTHNTLEDFFRQCRSAHVVMISTLDGHAPLYLRGFRDCLARYQPGPVLWYLGGNLTIGDAFGYEKWYRDLGFHRVFVKFTDVRTVLATLDEDLAGVVPVPRGDPIGQEPPAWTRRVRVAVNDDPLPLDTFRDRRREVLREWPSARCAQDLRDNAAFLSGAPRYAEAQDAVNAGRGSTLVQPRCGVASVAEQLRQFGIYKSVGADTLSYQVDTLTRHGKYAKVAEAIRESEDGGLSTLNGFPIVNHGVPVLRRVIQCTRMPLQTRHSTRSPELLAEISYAGGVSGFEGGPICYNVPYYKDYPLDEAISRWQYVDRLTGLYYERFGIALDREFFGVLTATLMPPCLAIASNILEAILAVRQGVKSVSVGYAEQGHRWQDLAAMRVLREKTRQTLSNLGYRDVRVSTVFHQYMAAFPNEPARAEELVLQSAATAAMSGATRIIVKTPAEPVRIPTVRDNTFAIHLVRRGFAIGRETPMREDKVDAECAVLRQEVDALLSAVIMRGRGVIADGIVGAFEDGLLDIPFAPSVYNRGDVVTSRDDEGAVRFLCTGRLPFDRSLVEWHRERMSRRRASEGVLQNSDSYLLVEKDVMAVPRGEYRTWPLSEVMDS